MKNMALRSGRSSLLIILALFTLPLAAAEEPDYVELQQRMTRWHVDYFVRDDLSVERITEFEAKALTENAAQSLKTHTFSYSTSIEESEVLEAYTLKSDGTRKGVPKDNYQVTTNKGNREDGPVFSDRTRVTLVYPDFEEGDSTVVRVKTTELEPMFPGHFSASQYYYNESAYDDVRVTINVPVSLKFEHQVRGMKESVRVEGDRKIIELTYSNPKPLRNSRQDFSVWDWEKESGFAISTFKTYKAIAQAYGDRASPKAVPTKRVEELAKTIVGDTRAKPEQARALYDWVASNITYAGNCIGVGAVVPHDTDFILDNRMGDCKDHATLLQALYSSVGIESTQALINSGSSYSLPTIPMVTSVNHVITYIPAFDKFVDATNDSMPFDLLGFSVSDKPVLLVDGYQDGLRTPVMKPADSQQTVKSSMSIQPDGSVIGNMEIELTGLPAVQVREIWRNVTGQQESEWIEAMFSSQANIGSGSVKKDDPRPLLSQFNYAFDFIRPEFIASEGAGGFHALPLGYSPLPVYAFLASSAEDINGYDVACQNGSSVEHLEYEFPDNIRILAQPDNLSIDENYLQYTATYKLEDNRLSVMREIRDTTPGNICNSDLMNAQRETIAKIAKNLRAQVVFQYH